MRRRGLLWCTCAGAVISAAGQAGASELVLHAFACPPRGATPQAGLFRDSAGNLFGTTHAGGAANAGVVYKLDASGRQTVLYSFTGGSDGGSPQSGVIRDPAGNLYGTTTSGGTSGAGVVYKLDTSGHETVLHSFTRGADGGYPTAGVILDSGGNLYGTALDGGTASAGVVFKLAPTGEETVLHNFTGGDDGANPVAGVIRDSAGDLYGTTQGGGTAGAGVVYRLDPTGHETVLYSFAYGPEGGNPAAGVIRDSAGNLYGTDVLGGVGFEGVVYKLDTAGVLTVLYSFTGADGGPPYTGVIRDADGNLYGTTSTLSSPSYGGIAYKIDVTGQKTTLYTFVGEAGGDGPNGLIRDSAGNLYGTTQGGGRALLGVVFMLNASGQAVLYNFPWTSDGAKPKAGVFMDSAGNLYGTTYGGGRGGAGIVYKLAPTGRETVLHTFSGGADGSGPYAGVILDAAGNLYGTTEYGGAADAGVVYKVTPTGQETVLYSFKGGADGGHPYAGLIGDPAGNLYGTTTKGGAANSGVVYKLDTGGHQTLLYSFMGGADGAGPYAGLVRDSAGNFYGTTYGGGASNAGTVYMLDGAGKERVLYSFTGGADGGHPFAGVVGDSNGNLYGTTISGGAAGAGVVYKLDRNGNEKVLHAFTGQEAYPYGGVIRDSAGNLYGTTEFGGRVYKLDTTGQETVLYSFMAGADGGYPYSGLIRDPAGNLYGTAARYGAGSQGVVFKITP